MNKDKVNIISFACKIACLSYHVNCCIKMQMRRTVLVRLINVRCSYCENKFKYIRVMSDIMMQMVNGVYQLIRMCDRRTWICCNCSHHRRVERCLRATIGREVRRRPPPCLEGPRRDWRAAEDHRAPAQSARLHRRQDGGSRAPSCTRRP